MTLRLMHVSRNGARGQDVYHCLQLPTAVYYTLIMLNSVFRAYKLVRLPLIAIAVVAVGNLIGSAGSGWGCAGCPTTGIRDRVEYLLGPPCSGWPATCTPSSGTAS